MIGRLKLYLAAAGAVAFALVASWFGGRKAATADIKVEQAERDLTNALRAKEIEDEVEALDRDALKSRSRKWVRGAND